MLVRNNALDCRAGGVRVRVPFFQPINPTEEIIESNATWGTSTAGYLTPQKVTADEQIMTILHRGFAYAVDDLSQMGTGADPMAAIRGYLTRAILKLRTNPDCHATACLAPLWLTVLWTSALTLALLTRATT